jgi:hypothetical protein
MFNVTRRDMGEFLCFMSQPVAITIEELVQWAWTRYSGRREKELLDARARQGLGHAWVVLWFSLTLPIYMKGCVEAGIVEDAMLGTTPLELGSTIARRMIETI